MISQVGELHPLVEADSAHQPITSASESSFFAALKRVIEFPLGSTTTFPGGPLPLPNLDASESLGTQDYPVVAPGVQLDLELTRFFDDDLWVERREVAHLLDQLRQPKQLTVLTGERGSGKSTIIRRVVNLLAASESDRLSLALPELLPVVADMLSLRNEIEAASLGGRLDLCGRLYNVFEQALFLTSSTYTERWETFLLLNDRHFGFLHRLAGTNRRDHATLQSLITKNRERYEQCLADFETSSGLHKLRMFLRFLSTSWERPIAFFVDNVDQSRSDVQANVARHLYDLLEDGTIAAAVVSVRPGTYEKIHRAGDGVVFPVDIEVDPLHEGLVTEDSEQTRDGANEFFLTFLAKRLAFLQERSRLLMIEGVPQNAAEGSLAAYRGMLEKLTHYSNSINIFGRLVAWYNGSNRAAAVSVAALFRSLIRDDRPVDDSLRPRDRIAVDRRFASTRVFRHMIRGSDDDGHAHLPSAPMLFSRESPTYVGKAGAPFLELHLLESLARRGVKTIGELRDHGSTELLAPMERVDAALRILWAPRGVDETGLIHIDEDRERLSKRSRPFNQNSEVKILAAGHFMLATLVPTCEYLYWSALDRSHGRRYLPRPVAPEDGLNSDGIRSHAAVEFFTRWIVPTFASYRQYLTSENIVASAAYERSYSAYEFERALATGLQNFIAGCRDIPRSERHALEERVSKAVPSVPSR